MHMPVFEFTLVVGLAQQLFFVISYMIVSLNFNFNGLHFFLFFFLKSLVWQCCDHFY